MIDFSPMWETMKRKNISEYDLIKYARLPKSLFDSIRAGDRKKINLWHIEMLVKLLRVNVEEVVKISRYD